MLCLPCLRASRCGAVDIVSNYHLARPCGTIEIKLGACKICDNIGKNRLFIRSVCLAQQMIDYCEFIVICTCRSINISGTVGSRCNLPGCTYWAGLSVAHNFKCTLSGFKRSFLIFIDIEERLQRYVSALITEDLSQRRKNTNMFALSTLQKLFIWSSIHGIDLAVWISKGYLKICMLSCVWWHEYDSNGSVHLIIYLEHSRFPGVNSRIVHLW